MAYIYPITHACIKNILRSLSLSLYICVCVYKYYKKFVAWKLTQPVYL